MASVSSSSKRTSGQQSWSNRSSSLVTSPNVSVTTLQESECSISQRIFNSTIHPSSEAYTRNESFDLLPKTDYTYAKSGSYSPRHLRKTYVIPNMSRRRLRGVVTPPVSLLEDSDSDVDLHDQTTQRQLLGIQQTNSATNTVSRTHSYTSSSSTNLASSSGDYRADQLDFDSDEGDLDSGEPVMTFSSNFRNKEQADNENLKLQQSVQSQGLEYRNNYEGMVLRSGSHLKGVKKFLDSRDSNHHKNMSVLNHSSANYTNNAVNVHETPVSKFYDQQQLSENTPNAVGYTTTTTTTVTKTVTEFDEDQINTNNSARARRLSRSPGKKRAYGDTVRYSDSVCGADESKWRSEERHREKKHRINHMYGLDQDDDDFSDSDYYLYSPSVTASNYAARKNKQGFLTRSVQAIFTMITVTIDWICRILESMFAPIQAFTITPVIHYAGGAYHVLCKQLVTVAKYFIQIDAWILSRINQKNLNFGYLFINPVVHYTGGAYHALCKQLVTVSKFFIQLDTWILSRSTRKAFCILLCFLLGLPLLFAAAPYAQRFVSVASSTLLTLPGALIPKQSVVSYRQGDTVQSINMHKTVKEILMQLQSENPDWLMRNEIDILVRSILKPEMDSLRVSLLNIANEGNFDQATLKVDQNDVKMRLVLLEEQMASLLAKEKLLEGDLADSRKHMAGTFNKERDKQASEFAAMQRSLAELKARLDSVQGSYTDVVHHAKGCCINDSTLIEAIRDNVNIILTETFGENERGGSGGRTFAVWLSENYVDRDEFERQLRLLTVDITDRINDGIEAHRGSSLVLPSGLGSLSEEAVKLIVEDALLKYSADRTGLPDYALESAGGSVLNVRCSETYYRKTALISVFGIPLWYASNSPRTVIQPDVYPGQCWAFKGKSGVIVIQLSTVIRPTGFSMEHIPKSLSMTGKIDSAPKDFTVFGLRSESDTKGVSLGNYTYQTVGKPIQHFDVQIRNPGTFGFVELRVLSNHGNDDYTCLYRFRVHGVPAK